MSGQPYSVMDFLEEDELIQRLWDWLELYKGIPSRVCGLLMSAELGPNQSEAFELLEEWIAWKASRENYAASKRYVSGPADGLPVDPEDLLQSVRSVDYSDTHEAIYELHECGNFHFVGFRAIEDHAAHRKSWRAD